MSKIDELFEFRIANINDIDSIMLFIKKEWNPNHILANDKDFFIWMYGNDNSEEINFVLMTDKNNNIKGINGFIPYSNNKSKLFISSAITKVSTSVCIPLAGVELIKRFHNIVNAEAYFSYATNPKTLIPIAKNVFHFDTGYMTHYYRLNDRIKNYSIPVINNKKVINYIEEEGQLKKILSEDEINCFDFERCYPNLPYKSKTFVIKRYFRHPIYEYILFFVLDDKGMQKGLLIAREIVVFDKKILRFVDYIGELTAIRTIGKAINDIIFEYNYEYADFYENGIPKTYMEDIGFIENTGENIIPHYFEPFVQDNMKLMYQRSNPNIIIFKADGDQDRPNHR